MFKNLNAGAAGMRGSAEELMGLAAAAGFAGMDLLPGVSPEVLQSLYEAHGLRVGGMGLPVDFRGDDAAFARDLGALPGLARAAAAVGCSRCATWLKPYSDDLSYVENFRRHVGRLRAVAEILGEHGIRLGLEYVGPLTSRQGHTYEFVHTMPQVLELCGAIGTGNLGLLLDSWHWYTAAETCADLRRLDRKLIVQVHVNDAPAGVPVEEQIDQVRELPGATGVIDLPGFLRSLADLGYDGPVTPEPFCAALRSMPTAEAARAVGDSLAAAWRAVGLAPGA